MWVLDTEHIRGDAIDAVGVNPEPRRKLRKGKACDALFFAAGDTFQHWRLLQSRLAIVLRAR